MVLDYLAKRGLLRQAAGLGAGGPLPQTPVTAASRGYPSGSSQAYALAQPGQNDPLRISDPTAGNWAAKYQAAEQEQKARLAVQLANMIAGTKPAPGIDYAGGGSGVVANDINGQLGPVVLPTPAPRENRMRGAAGTNQTPDELPAYAPANLTDMATQIQAMPNPRPATVAQDALAGAAVVALQSPVGDAAVWALDKMDVPRQRVVGQMGDSAYNVATGKAEHWDPGWAAIAPGNWMLPGIDQTRFNQDFQAWAEDPKNWESIRAAKEQGYNGFTGGRAVWELFISQAPASYRFIADFMNDPTTALPLAGEVGKSVRLKGLSLAADGNPILASTADAAGLLLEAPQRVLDAAVDIPFKMVGKLGRGILGSLADLTPVERARVMRSQFDEWAKQWLNVEKSGELPTTPASAATDVPPPTGLAPEGELLPTQPESIVDTPAPAAPVGEIRDGANTLPGFTVTARRDGKRYIDNLAESYPDTYAVVQPELRADPVVVRAEAALLDQTTHPVDEVIANAEIVGKTRSSFAKQGVDAPVDYAPDPYLNVADTAGRQAKLIEDVIFDPSSEVRKVARNQAYTDGLLQKSKPRANLYEDIVQANKPGRGKTYTIGGTKYEFTELLRMTPERREYLAKLAVNEQTKAYERYLRVAKAAEGIHEPLKGTPAGIVNAAPEYDRLATQVNASMGMRIEQPVPERTVVDWAFNRGKITTEARDGLNQLVEYQGRTMTFKEALDDALLHERAPAYRKGAAGVGPILDQEAVTRVLDQIAPLPVNGKKVPRGPWQRRSAKVWDSYKNAVQFSRESLQYNPKNATRGILTDQLGDTYTMWVTGNGDAALRSYNVRNWKPFIAHMTKGDELANLPYRGVLDKLGMDEFSSVKTALARDETARTGKMTAQRGLEALGVPEKAAYAASNAVQVKLAKEGRDALDLNRRWTLAVSTVKQQLPERRLRFMVTARREAERLHHDPDAWVAAIKSLGDEFSADDVRRALQNEDLARTWKRAVNEMRRDADANVNKILFSFKQTKMDSYLSKVFLFHYWQSRALVLHGRATLSNPWLLNAYVRFWNHSARQAEAEGWPSYMTGWLRFMGSDAGMMGMVDPIAVLVPFGMFTEMANGQNDGHSFKALTERFGVFVNPVLQGALAAMGYWDSTKVPDITGTRAVTSTVQAVINWGKANGVDFLPGKENSPAGNVVDDWTAWAIDHVNGVLSQMPGIREKDPYGIQTGSQIQEVRAIVEQRAIEMFGPRDQWTPAQIQYVDDAYNQVLMGGSNPLAAQAYEEWANATMLESTLRVLPGNTDIRYGPKDKTDAAAKQGDSAAYDQKSRQMAGSPESLNLDRLETERRAIGDDREQNARDAYNEIVYSTTLNPNEIMIVGGVEYGAMQLMHMTTDERKALAKEWLKENGLSDALDSFYVKRDAWDTANPAYAPVNEYYQTVRDYPGGVTEFIRDASGVNANFARSAREVEKRKGSDGLADWVLSLGGYTAYKGIRQTVYDGDPLSTGMVPSPTTTSASSTGGDAQRAKVLDEYDKLLADMDQWVTEQEAATKKLLAAGITAPLDQLNAPWLQPQIQQILGGSAPSPSARVRAYALWMSQQPEGTDVSPEAYAKAMGWT